MVGPWGRGRIDVFVRGTDNALYHKFYQSGWSDYEPLGGAISSGPDASSWGSNRLDVFARGKDNALYHQSYQDGWQRWEPLGSEPIASDPSAVSWGPGRIDVFARGADNQIHHKYFQREWSRDESVGAPAGGTSSAPDVSSWGANRLDLFVVGNDGAVWHRWYENRWGDWESLGAPGAAAPATIATGALRSGTLNPGLPAPSVTITDVTPVSATLGWKAVPSAVGYRVYRSTSATGQFLEVTTTPITLLTFTDALLAPSATFFWTVAAVYPSDRIGISAPVSGKTALATNPRNFVAFVPYQLQVFGQIHLQWDAVLGASYYMLTEPTLAYPGQPPIPQQPPQKVAGTTALDNPGAFLLSRYKIVAYFQRSDGQAVANENNPSQALGAMLPSHGILSSAPLTVLKWLTLPNAPGSASVTADYYNAIGATPNKSTFSKWLAASGFPVKLPFGNRTPVSGVPTLTLQVNDAVRARYFNSQDLNLGRDTECRQKADGTLACYQANAGPKPGEANFPSAATALDELVQGKPPFAMVAMDVVNGEVQFYAYGPDSNIVQAALLDDEGPKAIPQVCSACHGGLYDAAAKHVVNASFLPFDVSGFKFASAPGFTLADQQEAFRKLNSMVRASHPNKANTVHNPIVSLIDGWYGNVDTPGAKQNTSYVPPGWASKPNVYDIFARTCRTCHIAVSRPGLDFTDYQQLIALGPSLQRALCVQRTMPHDEPGFRKFWLDTLPFHPGYYEDASVFGITCRP